MTQRAPFRQSDLDRAVKVAAKNGWRVEIVEGVIRLLPSDPGATLRSVSADSDWDKALGLK